MASDGFANGRDCAQTNKKLAFSWRPEKVA
jgi:hypothetical protein